jgi:hypothetical protein
MSAVCAWLLTASVLFRVPPAAEPGALSLQSSNIVNAASDSVSAEPAESALSASSATPERDRSDAVAADGDLGPSTAPPWNPDGAVPRRRGWEQALGLPGRILTLPLVPVAWASERLLRRIESGGILVPRPQGSSRVEPGIGVSLASLGDRAGLGGRFEWKTIVLPGQFRSVLALSHAASVRHYHDTRVVLSGDLGEISYNYEWRPQEPFYGFGMDASRDLRTSYATQSERVQVALGFAWNRNRETRAPRTQTGFFAGTDSRVTKRGRDEDLPPADVLYPEVMEPILGERWEHFIFGFHFSSDWRTGAPHLANGWRVMVELERHDEPHEILALDTDHPGAQFTRATYELERRFSFMRDPRTIQIRTRIMDQHISSNPERMELGDYAKLGGHYGLGGFEPGRFHDLDMMYGKLAYIFPLVRRLEIEIHGEAGQVASDVWRTSRFDQFATSMGIGLRGRTSQRALGYIGFDWSREGVRARWSTGNPDNR